MILQAAPELCVYTQFNQQNPNDLELLACCAPPKNEHSLCSPFSGQTVDLVPTVVFPLWVWPPAG